MFELWTEPGQLSAWFPGSAQLKQPGASGGIFYPTVSRVDSSERLTDREREKTRIFLNM